MSEEGLIRVRAMTADDVQRVVELALGLDEAPHWPASAYLDFLRKEATPQRLALIAEADTGLVGFVVISIGAPEAELESIAVATGFQRKGIARTLWAEAAKQLRREHVTEVHLEVRASNAAAHGLYGSLGFAEAGRRARYYADPVEDAVLMHLRIV